MSTSPYDRSLSNTTISSTCLGLKINTVREDWETKVSYVTFILSLGLNFFFVSDLSLFRMLCIGTGAISTFSLFQITGKETVERRVDRVIKIYNYFWCLTCGGISQRVSDNGCYPVPMCDHSLLFLTRCLVSFVQTPKTTLTTLCVIKPGFLFDPC